MEPEKTAQGLADEGRRGFRLTTETRLHESADAASGVKRVLGPGALVTVRDDAGPFLYVITAEDEFGYIADETPVTPLQWTPPVERAENPALAPAAAQPARRWMDDMDTWNTPAMAAVQARSRSVEDDSFLPAAPPTPGERMLIYDRMGQNKRRTFILLVLFTLFLGAFFAAVGIFLGSYTTYTGEIDLNISIRIGIAAALFALGIGVLMYYTAPSAVMAISGGHEVTKKEEPVLYRIVENLSIGSGLPMPRVWVIEDSAPNAFATGRSPEGAHVATTRGLLDKLEKRELEAVMAHEVSHVGNYDVRLMTFLAVAVGLIAMISDVLLRFTRFGAGVRVSNRGKGGGALALIIIVAALLMIVVTPIVAGIIRLALSRQREYLADASGALLCRNPDALADALEKISADPEPLEAANKATAHLYIANPLKGHESFLNGLFATHPPVEDRVRILRAM